MSSISRVSDQMLVNANLRSVQGNLRNVANDNQMISSGLKYNTVSDSPLSYRRIMTWERTVEQNVSFQANISLAQSHLSASETALDAMEDLVVRAREIALAQINGTASEETRQSSALEVSAMIEEAVTLGNRQFGDRFLFGGENLDQPPFSRTGNYVAFNGNDSPMTSQISVNMYFETSISGATAFGGFSNEIASHGDLDPILNPKSAISDLNGGRGIDLGEIEIRDGLGGFQRVDLSSAKSVEDIVDLINNTGFATAALSSSGNSIEMSKTGADLSILDVNGGKTATDLGLAKTGMGAGFIGDDLNIMLSEGTLLSEINAGAGLSGGGFTIRNGDFSATIDTTNMQSIEDLLNAINSSGTLVNASIADNGKGISLVSTLGGADLFVEELAGSSTASDLGLILNSDEMPLNRLHGGRGVLETAGDDFRLNLADGSALDVDIDEAIHLGDVIDAINNHPENAGKVTASINGSPLSLQLVDNTAGANNFSVDILNGSFAVSGLGLDQDATGNTLNGSDLNPGGLRQNNIFDGFQYLHEGLIESSEVTLRLSLEALEAAEDKILDARGQLGGRIKRLDISQLRIELETIEVQNLISLEGDIDLAETIVQLNQHQNTLDAALQTSARILQQTILDFIG